MGWSNVNSAFAPSDHGDDENFDIDLNENLAEKTNMKLLSTWPTSTK